MSSGSARSKPLRGKPSVCNEKRRSASNAKSEKDKKKRSAKKQSNSARSRSGSEGTSGNRRGELIWTKKSGRTGTQ